MKKCLFLFFAVILSACAAEKPAERPAPADQRPYPEGLYATSSVVFFRAGKEGPVIRLQSLTMGAAEQDDAEKQTAPAAPTVGNKCPLSTVSPQPAATGAKLLQP